MPSRRFGLDGGSCKQLYALSELSVVRRAPGRGGSPSRPSRTELPTRNRPARRSGPTYPLILSASTSSSWEDPASPPLCLLKGFQQQFADIYSAATWAPFSATERFMNNTMTASTAPTTAKIRKQSK